MKKLLKNNQGFSLMELIVAVAIFIVMSVGLLNILSTSARTSKSVEEAMIIQQQTETVVSAVRANLANAEELGVFAAKPSAITGRA